ncbi:2-oxo-4-hydroxy-4-carboxy-5-ureidoimidazoline decarboxylase [Veronia pacifica]|uniref:2-oxo-4-hydroxy-4-carboxy-5-ureidoimidazoline decarboxylase n=1 Tax=Veronia pacifica TaxID=1080227 RepID=A0A1C3EPE3_9GAMM|nr:2-oxo-4-hydroxy-4-carboxy-5-ureidoimidazoline decarboxylase [Veronia pacifica]ODA35114.1 OHCU decarboxylase [Veronia pacifica]
MTHLTELNDLSEEDFVQLAGNLVENASWIVKSAANDRPFVSIDAMCEAIENVIRSLPEHELVSFFNAHPELAGMEAQEGTMTEASTGEQGRLGLLSLQKDQLSKLKSMNVEYRERFGFPFIIALRLQASLLTVFDEFEQRLTNSRELEVENATREIMQVVQGRAEQFEE